MTTLNPECFTYYPILETAMNQRGLSDNEQRLDQSNRILSAIRNVNRLITHAHDKETLLQGTCDCLTETQGYYNAWIALLDADKKLIAAYESGLDGAFQPMMGRLKDGDLTHCAARSLDGDDVVAIGDPPSDCADCPLSASYGGRGAMTARIAHKGRVFGLLSVSAPAAYVEEKDARELIADVAADLGYALFSMDAAASLRLHRHITGVLPNPMAILDANYRYQTVNEAYAMVYGVAPEEIVGRRVSDFYATDFFENAIRPHLDRCLAGEKVRYEVHVRFPAAGLRWMEMRYFPYRDVDGAVTGIVSMGTDITKKKQNEHHLKQRVKALQAFHLLSNLVEESRGLNEILMGVPDILVNAMQYCQVARAKARYDDHVYKSHPQCESDCDDCPHACLWEPLAVGGESRGELRVCYAERQPVSDGALFLNEERNLVHAVAERLGHICGRHQAEADLRKKNGMLQHMNLMLDMAPATIVVHTLEGRILYANQAAAAIHGYRHEEIMALKISDLDDGDSAALFHERVEGLKRNGEVAFEVLHRRKDGTTFPLKIFARTVDWDGASAILSVGADITYRKQAEKEMRLTLKAVSEGVWKWDFITNELQFSPIYYSMLGYAPDAFPATFESWKRLIHPDDLDAAIGVAEAYLKTQPDVYENVFRMRTRSGAYRWIQARGRVVERNASGAALRMIGNHVDITDRRRAEEKLRDVERRNQALLDHSPVCHKIVDLDFNLQYMSANGFKMLKLSADADVYGKPYPFAFFPETFRSEMTENMNRVKETGRTTAIEALTHDVEGNEVWLDSTLVPVLDDDGNIDYLTIVSADVTQRKRSEKEHKRLEGQLRQAQKMEAVGRLAGGVAHDFNNMLSLIIGHAEMALEDLDPSHPVYGDLEEIKRAGERSADLTRQLLAFARKQTVAPRALDLNEIVGGMLKMLRRLMGEDIDLAWLPGEAIWPVKIDPSQIDQILANLCVNARDAIAGVGKVAIETGNTAFDDAYCADHPGFSPGEYVFLSFSDTGCGMDPETRDNIFEPFFTTKESGRGTGLGLATVYGIVKQNDGFINVYSEPGLGTTFKIYLRRLAGGTDLSGKKETGRSASRGHETILLVEDEPPILKMTMMMLESLGYRVMAAKTPSEAVRLAREHVGEIHLLIADVVMPQMNGRDLAKNILTLQPHIKRLFMSGYTSDIIAHHGVLDEGVHFIQKPFSRQGLGARVRAVLDEESKSAD